VRRQHSVETINKSLAKRGLQVVAKKHYQAWPQANVERFYGEHKGRFFYPRLVHYMGSGPITAVVLKGPKAISSWRELIGPTHLQKARQTKDCLRGQFAISDTKNSFHGSDSIESAKSEIGQFFPDLDLDTILEPSKDEAIKTPL
jgi:nucleoside-diphosphate kinase